MKSKAKSSAVSLNGTDRHRDAPYFSMLNISFSLGLRIGSVAVTGSLMVLAFPVSLVANEMQVAYVTYIENGAD